MLDRILRSFITLGLPGILLLMVMRATGQTGNDAVWRGLSKLGNPFGLFGGLAILVAVGVGANFLSHLLVDELLVKFYQKRSRSQKREEMIAEIDNLPISTDLKIKIKWLMEHQRISSSVRFFVWIKRLFFIGVLIASFLSMTGYLGGVNRYFELTAHFKVQYCLVGVISGIFFLLIRQQKFWVIVSVFCVLLNLVEIVPWYFPQPAIASNAEMQPLRVLLSNVLFSNQQYDQVINLVKKEQPDIAVFVEVTDDWIEALAALKPMLPDSFADIKTGKFGVAIYSKIPLENKTIKRFSGSRPTLVADITVQGQSLSIIGTHPYLPISKGGFLSRNEQLAGLGDYVAQVKKPVIVMGDLNITMWSPFYQEFVKTAGLRNARSRFGILPTWPTDKPLLYIPIDHCLVTPEIQVTQTRTGKNIGSDHLPVITDLRIPLPKI